MPARISRATSSGSRKRCARRPRRSGRSSRASPRISCARMRRRRSPTRNSRTPARCSARRSPPIRRTPAHGSRSPSSARRRTMRRRTGVTIWSRAARPPPMPPTAARAAPPLRPRRSPCSAISSRGSEFWRPALDAYRASLDRRDDEDTRKVYEDLREKHGFRIVDYKVDNEFGFSPRLLQFFRAARPQDGFRALRRGGGRGERGAFERGAADLRRRPPARRALRDRRASGPAVRRRRIAAQIRGLRNLRARSLAAGAFRRQGLRAAAAGPARRAAHHRQHHEGFHRRLSRRRPQSHEFGDARRFSQTDFGLARERDREPGRREGLERRRWTSLPY